MVGAATDGVGTAVTGAWMKLGSLVVAGAPVVLTGTAEGAGAALVMNAATVLAGEAVVGTGAAVVVEGAAVVDAGAAVVGTGAAVEVSGAT